MLRSLRAAFVFLTRIPVGGFPYRPVEWRWAPAHFPLVGGVLGLGLGLVDRALLPLGDLAAAFLALSFSLMATGAFHEDGLADTSDALGGAFDRAKIFVILKDSRVGTFGAASLVISIAGRASLAARLGDAAAWAFPLVFAVARLGPVWQMVAMPYVTEAGAARSREVTRAGVPQACVATLEALAVAGIVGAVGPWPPARLGAVFCACAVVTLATAQRFARRAGGITGDFLGATEQLCELAAFAALAWGTR